MCEYRLERVDLTIGAHGNAKEDYHQIVGRHAAAGWRLAHVFCPPTYAGGIATFFELVFEREKQKQPKQSHRSVTQIGLFLRLYRFTASRESIGSVRDH